jgi:hypothetical protein
MSLDRRIPSLSARKPQGKLMAMASVAIVATLFAEDWIAGVAVCVLWVGWQYLRSDEGPPVLALAFSFQWVQVVSGIFYYGASRRVLPAMDVSDYRPMVLIGLGCLVALLLGLRSGTTLARESWLAVERGPSLAFTGGKLLLCYAVSAVLSGIIQELAWQISALTQAILALNFIPLILLFLMLRRLTQPQFQWRWIGGLLLGEVVLGFTGYFAEFREPLMVATLALLEAFDRRKVQHWLALTVLAVVMSLSSVMWMGIRGDYRGDFESEMFAQSRTARLERVASLASQWLVSDVDGLLSNLDSFVGRLWAVYYPALAVSRVPLVLPHANGAIMWGALQHLLTPRLLFPEKGVLESDSEMVRNYSGVQVSGTEQGTSIAFGYAAESYLDFGLPWMFIPVFVYGLLMGLAYRWFLRVIYHRELAVALVTVVFWLSL